MKKLYLILLALVCSVGMMWGEVVLYQTTLTSAGIASGATVFAQDKISSNETCYQTTSSTGYLTLTFDPKINLSVNDKIDIVWCPNSTSNRTPKFTINKESTISGTQAKNYDDVTYTITRSSACELENLKIAGSGSSGIQFKSIKIYKEQTVPVDPTVTFDDGSYEIGGNALDLSSLFTSNSEGTVTYTVKDAGTTGATISGTNFTATAVGTAVVTASQAATASYNAKTADATITVNAPAPKTVYLNPGVWNAGGAKFAIYYYNNTSNGWSDFMTEVPCASGMFTTTIPSDATTMNVVRLSNDATEGDWNKKWNQTANITITTNDYIQITGWGESGKDSPHTYNSNYSEPTFSITYKSNYQGGAEDIVVSDLACGDSHTVKAADTFTREGWKFIEWKQGGTGTPYAPGTEITMSEDLTLYAHWEKWSVNGDFDGNGNWDDYPIVDGSVDINITAGADRAFVIKYNRTDNNEKNYYNTGTMTSGNCTGWNMKATTEYGQSCKITPTSTGKYTFTLVNNTPQISVTYPKSLVPISEATTWDWSKYSGGVQRSNTSTPSISEEVIYSNAEASITLQDGFGPANSLSFTGEYPARSSKNFCQNGTLHFKGASKGYIRVKFSDTGSKTPTGERYLNVNGINTTYYTQRTGSTNDTKTTDWISVPAGDVYIKACYDNGNNIAVCVYSLEWKPTLSQDDNLAGEMMALAAKVDDYEKAFSTFCADKKFKVKGAKAYIASLNGSVLQMRELAVVPANTGVILASEDATTYYIDYSTTAAASDASQNALKGTTDRTLTSELKTIGGTYEKILALQSSTATFKNYTGEYFPANKAYLPLPAEGQAPTRLEFTNPTGPGITTGVEEVLNKYVKSAKTLINGKLYIVRENRIFDLNGRILQ